MNSLDFTIVGAPRSGTSLLSSLVDRHPDVRIAHDSGLYYYLKFALIQSLYFQQSGQNLSHVDTWRNVPLINLSNYDFVDRFLEESPQDLLSRTASNLCRSTFDEYLMLLWRFWTHDFNSPDPTKDRNKSSVFLRCIDTHELLGASSIKDLINIYQSSFIASINGESKENYKKPVLIGEKTPDNNLCGDILNKFNKNIKAIEITRNPCSLYAARKKRNFCKDVDEFVGWYQAFAIRRHFEEGQVLTIKYENLISSTSDSLNSIYNFLGLDPFYTEDSECLTSNASHTLYTKYVGDKVDKKRNHALIELLTDSEINSILKEIPY